MARITKDLASVAYQTVVYLSKSANVRWWTGGSIRQDRELVREDVKLRLRAKQIHAGLMIACNSTYITPEALKAISKKTFTIIKQRRNNIAAKVMRRFRVLCVLTQSLKKQVCAKDIDSHGRQVGLWLFGFLGKLGDPILIINGHDAEARGLFPRNRHDGNRKVCVVLLMAGEHLAVVHTVKLIAREN